MGHGLPRACPTLLRLVPCPRYKSPQYTYAIRCNSALSDPSCRRSPLLRGRIERTIGGGWVVHTALAAYLSPLACLALRYPFWCLTSLSDLRPRFTPPP